MSDPSRTGTPAAAWLTSLSTLAFVLAVTTAAAQSPLPDTTSAQSMRPRVGVYGALGLNMHSGEHYGAPEALSCIEFDGGSFGGASGLGGAIGFLFELPLSQMFAVMARAGYTGLGADDVEEVPIGPILVNGEPVPGISEYSFNNRLEALQADFTLGIRPFDVPLSFRIGPELGFIFAASYDQNERLKSPAEAVFIAEDSSSTKVRNLYAGPLENVGVRVAALIGADYELPMNAQKTLLLVPEVAYSFAFTDVRSDMNWSAHQLRLGVALKYSLPLPSPPIPPPVEPPPPDPAIAAALDIVSVSADGTERQDFPIRVEEFINTQTRAFLNYVFFEEGSAEIPERYIVYLEDARRRFNTAALHNKSKLEVYYQSLNVLGSRMLEYPSSKITLTGTNANVGVELGNLDLSRRRAEAVRDYLVRSWGIDPKRIAIAARNLPAVASNPDSADGIEENRRVEVATDHLELISPVETMDTLRTVDPPVLRLRGTQTVEAGPGEWRMVLAQGGRTLGQLEGRGTPMQAIDFNLLDDPQRIPLTEEPIIATYVQTDARGRTVTSTDQANVDQVTIQRKREEQLGDVTFENYNLITFEFDKSTLSPINRRIANVIKGRIRPTSEVEIIGYTDRLGLAEHNLELSRQRALSTAAALGVSAANARGAGENTTLFDNELPEGRFLSRTVDVSVRTRIAPGE